MFSVQCRFAGCAVRHLGVERPLTSLSNSPIITILATDQGGKAEIRHWSTK